MQHEMKLQPEPFALVKAGVKIIESRLYDKKRQRIKLGDLIIFKNMAKSDETIGTKVDGLLRYPTFRAMFTDFPAEYFGGESKNVLEKQIFTYYSKADEAKYGVLGIRISKV